MEESGAKGGRTTNQSNQGKNLQLVYSPQGVGKSQTQ